MTGRPLRLNQWKEHRLRLLWPDAAVSTRAICHELDLGKSSLQKHAKRLGLGYRPGCDNQYLELPKRVA